MIVAVTLNSALDLTYEVPRLKPHQSHRVTFAAKCAGGKGINVARTLTQLHVETTALGFAGGITGAELRADLDRSSIPHVLCQIAGETRRTVSVISTDHAQATVFNEPGPSIASGEWLAFLKRFEALLPSAGAVVLAGSIPPGLSSRAYAEMSVAATQMGVPVIVDADGEPLRESLPARPAVVKINASELAAHVGHRDVLAGARTLCAHGAESAVVTLGAAGMVAVTPAGAWRATPSTHLHGNPTGAGDAATAAIANGLVTKQSWPERLRDAVALSGATVLCRTAGSFDLSTYRSLLDAVTVQEFPVETRTGLCR